MKYSKEREILEIRSSDLEAKQQIENTSYGYEYWAHFCPELAHFASAVSAEMD